MCPASPAVGSRISDRLIPVSFSAAARATNTLPGRSSPLVGGSLEASPADGASAVMRTIGKWRHCNERPVLVPFFAADSEMHLGTLTCQEATAFGRRTKEAVMEPITRAADVNQFELRELALEAVWVASLEEAVEALEDLVVDLGDTDHEGEQTADANDGDDDPLAVALSVVQAAYEDADRAL